MNRIVLRLALTIAALHTALAGISFADSITISGHNDYRSGLGGEFNVRPADASGAALLSVLSTGYTTIGGTTVGTADGTRMNAGYNNIIGFQTFCIEYNESISLNGTYLAAISNGAILGGVNGGIDPDNGGPLPKKDTISVGTAFLYTKFATGVLSGYVYNSDVPSGARAASAATLQKAIWYLEDEISYSSAGGASNSFLQLAFAALGTPNSSKVGNAAGGAKADNTTYNVKVLNLTDQYGHKKQDQLIMVQAVPDGGLTATFLGLALGGLALVRRRYH